MWRLLQQGADLHQTGHLSVMLAPNPAANCRAFGERVAAGDLGIAREALRDAEEAFDRPGVLPDRPDEEAAEKWLRSVRRAYLEVQHVDPVTEGAELSAFTCPCCGMTSHHPEDIRQGYCGACHWWTGDPVLGPSHDPAACPARVEQETDGLDALDWEG
jgi:hypothetical protein